MQNNYTSTLSNYNSAVIIDNGSISSRLIAEELKLFEFDQAKFYTNGIGNNKVADENNVDLLDVVDLESKIDTAKLVIFIDLIDKRNFSSKEFKNNLSAVANITNLCLESGCQKFIYLSTFTSAFGSHNMLEINEESIWEASATLDLKDKYIHLANQEVYRALNEGLNAHIISSGIIVSDDSIKNNAILHSLLPFTSEILHFTHFKDMGRCIAKLLESNVAIHKLLVIESGINKSEIEKTLNYKPNFLNAFINFLKQKSTARNITINNTKSLTFIGQPLKSIHEILFK